MRTFICLLLFFIGSVNFLFSQDKEAKLTDVYFTDKYGEVIRSRIPDDKFYYFVVESVNMVGLDVTIDWLEDDEPVIYKNQYIGPFLSFEYRIEKDIEKLKLIPFDENKKKHQRLKAEATTKLIQITKE